MSHHGFSIPICLALLTRLSPQLDCGVCALVIWYALLEVRSELRLGALPATTIGDFGDSSPLLIVRQSSILSAKPFGFHECTL